MVSAKLELKTIYNRASVDIMKNQFAGIVKKYRNILCQVPEECQIGDLKITNAVSKESHFFI